MLNKRIIYMQIQTTVEISIIIGLISCTFNFNTKLKERAELHNRKMMKIQQQNSVFENNTWNDYFALA